MKIAMCSDEPYAMNFELMKHLESLGHQVTPFGSLKTNKDEPWAHVTHEASEAVRKGLCDEGIFFCWTGTGSSIVANKVPGIRAALCTDAETAKGARVWNRANVLVLSNRLISFDLAKEITNAWLHSSYTGKADEALAEIEKMDRRT